MQAIANRVVKLEGYSCEIASDFWDREMSLDGIETIQTMIKTLKGTNGDTSAGH